MQSVAARPTVRDLAKRVSFLVDDVLPTEAGTVVLAYHRVGQRTVSPVDIDTSSFRRQMAHLRAGSTVLTLDELATASGTSEGPRMHGVVLTFDDGTADFVDEVLPVLVEYDLPATLYLATGPVDSRTPYPANGEPITWNGLREALSTGLVSIGAHTHTHRLLDRCTPSEAAEELDRSNERIGAELGVQPKHFAYPKAVLASPDVEVEVIARYTTAAVAGTRPNTAPLDLHRLRRSPIQVADGWEGFRRKVAGGMRAEDDIRRVANRFRYRSQLT